MLNGDPSTSKQESSANENKASKESKDPNHCQDDSDEQIDNGEKKKKANKNKWVPLEIDLAQRRGTVRSSRFHNHRDRNGEVNDDEHWREKSYDRSTGYQRGRGGRSYRGRGRGGRNRGSFRYRQDNEYANYNADYMQVICRSMLRKLNC